MNERWASHEVAYIRIQPHARRAGARDEGEGMMIGLLIIGVIILAILVMWFSRKPAATVYYEDDTIMTEMELYEQEYAAPISAEPQPYFIVDQWYAEADVENLLWSLGHTQAQVKEALNHGYVSVFREGISAAFQHYGEWIDPIVYRCEAFDANADTSSVDRWERQPTEDERRKAVWG